jgi:hypothetical protein
MASTEIFVYYLQGSSGDRYEDTVFVLCCQSVLWFEVTAQRSHRARSLSFPTSKLSTSGPGVHSTLPHFNDAIRTPRNVQSKIQCIEASHASDYLAFPLEMDIQPSWARQCSPHRAPDINQR